MVYMHVYLYFFLVPEKGRKGHQIPTGSRVICLWAVMWALEIEPRFPKTSTPNPSAISWAHSPEFLVFLQPSPKSYDMWYVCITITSLVLYVALFCFMCLFYFDCFCQSTNPQKYEINNFIFKSHSIFFLKLATKYLLSLVGGRPTIS